MFPVLVPDEYVAGFHAQLPDDGAGLRPVVVMHRVVQRPLHAPAQVGQHILAGDGDGLGDAHCDAPWLDSCCPLLIQHGQDGVKRNGEGALRPPRSPRLYRVS